jgi:AraC-like DNA-binding protein
MDVRYEEWPPGRALEGIVTALWRVTGDPSKMPPSQVLPDGHVELVLNLGAPVDLAGPAFTGDQPRHSVVGLVSCSLRLDYRGPIDTFGIRFHPARGPGFFGLRAPALSEKVLPLGQVCPTLDRSLSNLVAQRGRLESQADRAQLEAILLEQRPRALPQDPEIVRVVDRLAAAGDTPSIAVLARDVGISPRQLQRRFLAAVGVTPKRFVRLIRFARVWQVASMQPEEAWASLAVEHGYADQAHLVREFRAFGAVPPTRFFSSAWYAATAFSRATGPARGVRFVQEAVARPALRSGPAGAPPRSAVRKR